MGAVFDADCRAFDHAIARPGEGVGHRLVERVGRRGGDVGADALLQDGRRLWLFGDTLRGGQAGPTYVRNSMLVTDEKCIRAVVPESGGALIPDRTGAGENPVGYWPMSTVVDERAGYDLLYVTTQRVRTTGSDASSLIEPSGRS